MAGFLTAAFFLSPGCAVPAQQGQGPATLPQVRVDVEYEEPGGDVHHLGAGDDLQAALDAAAPGDVIELQAGAVYEGPFVLPRKEGEKWIVIRSAGARPLPPPGTRVTPSDAPAMATLVSASGPVIRTAPGAHHYRLIGLEITPASEARGLARLRGAVRSLAGGAQGEAPFLYNLVVLSANDQPRENLPHHLILERCYLHGDTEVGTRRGIALNSGEAAVIDSWLSGFKEVGGDSQAIAGGGGPGPYLIRNNYLEGAGENLLFGGFDPVIEDLVPADIEILHNHFSKPLDWRKDSAEYAGTPWSVKNLLQLKNSRRVLIEGNLFEHNWPDAQNGFAILFTVRNQDGGAPWSVVEDVTFRNNLLREVASGINILGFDDIHDSRQTRRIVIRNNLFAEVGNDWGQGNLIQVLDAVQDLVIERNTSLQEGHILWSEGRPHRGFIFTGNIVRHNLYGIIGRDTGPGHSTVHKYFPDGRLEGNLLIGAPVGSYSGDNEYASSLEQVGFADAASGDYRLAEDATGHRRETPRAGVDFGALCSALASSERPDFCHETLRQAANSP
jgi:hypothetical protein